MPIVYLNGNYVAQEDATISVMDRGFLFGDSIYDVVPSYNGHLVGGQAHYDRLVNSLNAVLMTVPFDFATMQTIMLTLLEKNNAAQGNASIYLQITRGADTLRGHALPKHISQTIVAFVQPPLKHTKTSLEKGFKAITREDNRKKDNYVKSTALIDIVLLYEQALSAGALEAILIRNDMITECTSSNLFIVKDGTLYTPKLHAGILPGITRQLILAFARDQNMPTQEIDLPKAMLLDADEIWVTGSRKEICPIIELDGKTVGTGEVGPLWHRVYDWYDHFKQEPS